MEVSPIQHKRIKLAFFLFWLLLAYVVTAHAFWYITLNKQIDQIEQFKKEQAIQAGSDPAVLKKIEEEKRLRRIQFIGEGGTFLVLILFAAAVIYYLVRRQIKNAIREQNFLMAITHELKTPISVTKLNLETIIKRNLDDDMRNKLIQKALNETIRLNDLSNNLLLSSQVEAGRYSFEKSPVDLSQIVQKVIDDFKARFPERNIQSIVEEHVEVVADEFSMELVIRNLLENAHKYSPKDKAVTIRLSTDNTFAVLKVEDEGNGLTAYEKRKIFMKHYRAGNEATSKSKGTGLGLYIVNQIIKHSKGKVEVIDNSPSGSIFIVRLKTYHES